MCFNFIKYKSKKESVFGEKSKMASIPIVNFEFGEINFYGLTILFLKIFKFK